jgi:hypothetical protein
MFVVRLWWCRRRAATGSAVLRGSRAANNHTGYGFWWRCVRLLRRAGSICAAFVFGLASQSALAPLGSVTMILNTVLAWRFLGERFTTVDAISTVLMACGTTVAVAFSKNTNTSYT